MPAPIKKSMGSAAKAVMTATVALSSRRKRASSERIFFVSQRVCKAAVLAHIRLSKAYTYMDFFMNCC